MACGECGLGRMAEPEEILAAIEALVRAEARCRPARPGHQRPDARADRSRCASSATARPAGRAMPSPQRWRGSAPRPRWSPARPAIADPPGVHVRPGRDGGARCWPPASAALPVDVAVCAAAVADWRVAAQAAQKIKKRQRAADARAGENPDILATLSQAGNARPALVVGFAAETERVVEQRADKASGARAATGSSPMTSRRAPALSAATTTLVHLISAAGVEDWPELIEARSGRPAGRAHRRAFRRGAVSAHDGDRSHSAAGPRRGPSPARLRHGR